MATPLPKVYPILSSGKTLEMMEENRAQPDFSKEKTTVNGPVREKKNGDQSNKCYLCDYASSRAGYLKRHMKTHRKEKPNKCNQCYFASIRAGDLRRHLKMHSGEKSNKCNQCDFASFMADSLRTHL